MRRSFNNVSRQVAGEIVTRAMVGHSTEAMTAHDEVISLDEKRAALSAAPGKLGSDLPPAGDRCWGSEKNAGVSTGG
ncbi:MAG: hypothetical protein ABIJ09_15360 [Pseudomonadota bacterium]